MSLPVARKIQSPAEVDALEKSMEGQDSLIVAPTHIIRKDSAIVGHWAINSIPVVQAWHDDGLINRDSYYLINTLQTLLDDRGINRHMIALSKESPYNPLMQRVGYTLAGNANLYIGGTHVQL